MKPKLLVINADDYGLVPFVDQAILKLLETKKISHTTVLTNQEKFTTEISLLRSTTSARHIGLHFNITEGYSLGRNYQTLTDSHSKFFGKAKVYELLAHKQMDLNEVLTECKLQLKQLKEEVPGLAHFDSHNHIHLFPEIFEVLCPYLLSEGIQTIRLPLEPFTETSKFSQKAQSLFSLIQQKKLKFCQQFYGLNTLGNPSFPALGPLESFFQSSNVTSLEWMVHPGFSGDSFYGSSILTPKSRECEFEFLRSKQLQRFLDFYSFTLGTFQDIEEL